MNTPCIEWTGSIDRDGYGRAWKEGKGVLAHRLAYEEQVGPIPDGLTIDHLCENRSCVNVLHLEPVTQKVNNLRSPRTLASINTAKTHCPREHEYTPANTYYYRGGRYCRACGVIRTAAARARRKNL